MVNIDETGIYDVIIRNVYTVFVKVAMINYTESQKYWIWMASVPELGPKTFYYILKQFGGAENFFDAVRKGSKLLESVPAQALKAARAACSAQRVSEMVAEMKSKDITALTRLDEDYPRLLSKIPCPPPVLFVKGKIGGLFDSNENLRCISIVGTRRCTRRGAEFSRMFSEEIAGAGIAVVSGMARGIDTTAHKGALAAGGRTVAVLGCGVDVIYPAENDEVYYDVMENGAVVSELPPGAQPIAANFPVRNRIIAGLTPATLIVESEMEGGTAITASMAVSNGRELFAVPGAPYMSMSALPNALIKNGASIVLEAGDVLGFYGIKTGKEAKSDIEKHIQLDFLQRQIYNLLLQGDSSVENMAICIEYPQSEINAALTLMELGGLIKRLPGGKFGV